MTRIPVLVPTRSRPGRLVCLIDSVLQNASSHGDTLDLLICDQSTETQELMIELNALSRKYEEHQIRYLGYRAQEAVIADLSVASGDGATVEFALARNLWGSSFGSNRNIGTLLYAGRSFASFDDDVCCEPLWVSNDLFRDIEADRTPPWSYVSFATAEKLEENIQKYDVSVARELLDSLSAKFYAQEDIGTINTDVKISSCGMVGDSGLGTHAALPLITCSDSLREAHASSHAFEIQLLSPYGIRQAARKTVSTPYAFLSTTFGLANETPLLPFFPFDRGEDHILATTLEVTDPLARIVHLPFSLRHAQSGSWRPHPRLTGLSLGVVIGAVLSFGVKSRLTQHEGVGTVLERFGQMPTAQWDTLIREILASFVIEQIEVWRRFLNSDIGLEDFLHGDRQLLDWISKYKLISADSLDRLMQLPDGTNLQSALLNYGKLLNAWSLLWRLSQDLGLLESRSQRF